MVLVSTKDVVSVIIPPSIAESGALIAVSDMAFERFIIIMVSC